jgi:hypothetical protein
MAPVTDTPAVKALSRQLVKALRVLVLPIKRRVCNHDEHIRHLLAVSKEMRREIDALKEDLSNAKKRIQWGEEA